MPLHKCYNGTSICTWDSPSSILFPVPSTNALSNTQRKGRCGYFCNCPHSQHPLAVTKDHTPIPTGVKEGSSERGKNAGRNARSLISRQREQRLQLLKLHYFRRPFPVLQGRHKKLAGKSQQRVVSTRKAGGCGAESSLYGVRRGSLERRTLSHSRSGTRTSTSCLI